LKKKHQLFEASAFDVYSRIPSGLSLIMQEIINWL